MRGSSQQGYQLGSPSAEMRAKGGEFQRGKRSPFPQGNLSKNRHPVSFNQNHQLICNLGHLAPQSSRCSALAPTNFNRNRYSGHSRGMGTRQTVSEQGVGKDIHSTGFLESSKCQLASILMVELSHHHGHNCFGRAPSAPIHV